MKTIHYSWMVPILALAIMVSALMSGPARAGGDIFIVPPGAPEIPEDWVPPDEDGLVVSEYIGWAGYQLGNVFKNAHPGYLGTMYCRDHAGDNEYFIGNLSKQAMIEADGLDFNKLAVKLGIRVYYLCIYKDSM